MFGMTAGPFPPLLSLGIRPPLSHAGDAEVYPAFGDQFENRLKRRLLRQPAALRSFVSTIVLVKQALRERKQGHPT
jgi:hypothetical protein